MLQDFTGKDIVLTDTYQKEDQGIRFFKGATFDIIGVHNGSVWLKLISPIEKMEEEITYLNKAQIKQKAKTRSNEDIYYNFLLNDFTIHIDHFNKKAKYELKNKKTFDLLKTVPICKHALTEIIKVLLYEEFSYNCKLTKEFIQKVKTDFKEHYDIFDIDLLEGFTYESASNPFGNDTLLIFTNPNGKKSYLWFGFNNEFDLYDNNIFNL